jgi:DNA-binding PadR family transcriptional regulator
MSPPIIKLPQLSHAQFVVVGSLMDGPVAGRDVRTELAGYGVRHSGPAFYQLMARMEDAGLIEGWYVQDVVDGQIIRERHYRILAAGRRAWRDTRRFYARAGGLVTRTWGMACA